MSEAFKLCEQLQPLEICFVVEQYGQGQLTRIFHKHVSKFRLSEDARVNVLRALVIHFSQMGEELIVSCFLNKNGSEPAADDTLTIITEYPEPGVFRCYCGTNTKGWSDQVISPAKFRNNIKENTRLNRRLS